MVLVLLPSHQLLPHIIQHEVDFHVHTLITEPPIEAFNEAILDRFAGRVGEFMTVLLFIKPLQEGGLKSFMQTIDQMARH